MDKVTPVETPARKVYGLTSIVIASIIGGPLATGILMGHNFRVFNDYRKVAISCCFFLLNAAALPFIMRYFIFHDISWLIIPVINGVITLSVLLLFQNKKLIGYISSGGRKYNWWLALVLGVAAAVISFYFMGFMCLLAIFAGFSRPMVI